MPPTDSPVVNRGSTGSLKAHQDLEVVSMSGESDISSRELLDPLDRGSIPGSTLTSDGSRRPSGRSPLPPLEPIGNKQTLPVLATSQNPLGRKKAPLESPGADINKVEASKKPQQSSTNTQKINELLDAPLHPEDQKLLQEGMSEETIKALRHRRESRFANTINGSVKEGRLTNSILCAYSAPSFSTVPLTVLISVYVVQFYEKLGASLALIAFFQALARGLDVVTDPMMSHVTDTWRSPKGRRRPFLMMGCLPYAIALIGLMFPYPSLRAESLSYWFGGFYILFFLFNTFTNIPYDAMAPELTDNPKDRSKLFFVCTLFDGLGALCAVIFPVGIQQAVNIFRQPNNASCNVPVNGKINLSGCASTWFVGASTLSTGLACKNWNMALSSAALGYDSSMCTASVLNNTSGSSIGALYGWCSCITDCAQATKLDNMRGSYLLVGCFFGLW